MKRICALFLGFLFLAALLPRPPAAAHELDEIRFAIQSRAARWIAAETPMTRLPFAERQKRLGLRHPTLAGAGHLLSIPPPLTALPATLDWRNNGGNFVTPIRDQGNCGSCWAFATAAALESSTLIATGAPDIDLNLAEQILLSCGQAGSCEDGGSIDLASNFIRDTGLPLESCYPYTAANGNCAGACPNWQSSSYQISSWKWVATGAPAAESLKDALAAYGPLVTTMAVYNDFFSYRSGVYSHTSGSLAGYHAIALIGFDEPGQYFIVKNSWGSGWGEAGFFRIAFSELSSLVAFGQYTIAYSPGAPSCAYSISPSGQSFSTSGGTGSVSVASADGCAWSSASNAGWITITSGNNGTGNGTVGYTVAANPGGGSRTASLTIAGRSFTVSQAGGGSCITSISPASGSFDALGGSGVVNVTTSLGCGWTALSNTGWILVTSSSSGTGNGAVNYSVAANPEIFPRTGTLTIAGKTLTVSQGGQSCSFAIAPTSQSFNASGGRGSVNVTAQSGCGWTAGSNVSWAMIDSAGNGSGSGMVNFTVQANPASASRSGTLAIAGKTFAISQAGSGGGASIQLSATSLDFGRVKVGRPVVKTLTISNPGSADLVIETITTVTSTPGNFTWAGGCATIAPGSVCTLSVKFQPLYPGMKGTTLNIYSNARGGIARVYLKGTGY